MSNIDKLFSMKGKTVLVTGAGSGMGARFAQVLADAGATVVCAARRVDKLEETVAKIKAAGGNAVAVGVDVGDSKSVENLFDQAEKSVGQINVLINAAAQVDFGLFPDVEDERWQNLINVNFSGIMRTSRSFSRRLIDAGKPGTIVNVTSIIAEQVMLGVPVYGSLKAAANHFTRSMARDMFDKGIRCNAIAPGYFLTDMVEAYFETDAGKADIERHPMKRLGRVDELDGALLLLASDASSFINGAVLSVDAGQVIQLH